MIREMDLYASIHVWLEYILRFSHLVAGIAWVGSSFYFIWLDSSFEVPEKPRRNVDGELYMVHGGFYYQVEKRKIYPGEMPRVLHWFKWEATLTWITGFLLFIYLYWMRGASLLIDSQVKELSPFAAIWMSLLILIVAWIIYDLIIWNAYVIRAKWISVLLSVGFFGSLIFGLFRTFSGRGAFIMTGVIFGTMMILNVWVRILPGQRKMLREAEAGQVPDYSVSLKSKVRSVHNTYFIFPVLFIMLSNHYPLIYNHKWNWLLLIVLAVSGAMTRHAMVTKSAKERWVLVPAAIGLAGLVYMTGSPHALSSSNLATPVDTQTTATTGSLPPIEYSNIQGIVQARCLSCHSRSNTDDMYKVAPSGIYFETEHELRSRGDKLMLHVVLAKSMPLANKTKMTEDERAMFARWLKDSKIAN